MAAKTLASVKVQAAAAKAMTRLKTKTRDPKSAKAKRAASSSRAAPKAAAKKSAAKRRNTGRVPPAEEDRPEGTEAPVPDLPAESRRRLKAGRLPAKDDDDDDDDEAAEAEKEERQEKETANHLFCVVGCRRPMRKKKSKKDKDEDEAVDGFICRSTRKIRECLNLILETPTGQRLEWFVART